MLILCGELTTPVGLIEKAFFIGDEMEDKMELVQWDKIKSEIANCQDIQKLSQLDYGMEAIQKWAKQSKQSLEAQNEIAEYRLRINRKRGLWIENNIPKDGSSGGRPANNLTENSQVIPTLKFAAIDRNESPKLRAIAALPEKEFEKYIDKAKENKEELTTKGLVNFALNAAREERQENLVQPDLPADKYRIIYADPPWRYDADFMDKYGHAESHYKTMTIDELCDLPIADLTQPDAVLFLWVTSPKLEYAFDIIKAWGFKYKTSFIWDKVGHNFGYYNSVRHEFLLIAGKGSSTPDEKKLYDSVVTIEKSKIHSEKPEYFREIIDFLYPVGNRIELFARSQHEGWDSWGAEV